jgi:hypothetical protein
MIYSINQLFSNQVNSRQRDLYPTSQSKKRLCPRFAMGSLPGEFV